MTCWVGRVGNCYWSCVFGALTEESLDRFIAGIEGAGRSPLSRIVIIDFIHDVTFPSPVQRRRVARAVAALPNKSSIAGHAVVSNSSVARAVVTAVNWFSPPSFPERVVATPEDAFSWLEGCGLSVSREAVLADIVAHCPEYTLRRW